MGKIYLEGMEFYAYHGCFAEEQLIGGRFIIDVVMETDTFAAGQSDNLHDTVNYQEVYLLIKKEMEIKSKLLEHVATRIAQAIKVHFPAVSHVKVKVSKMNPPLGGKLNNVSVEVEL